MKITLQPTEDYGEMERPPIVTIQTDRDDLNMEAVADLFRHDGTAQLVLITCGGSFDHRARAYRDNIVLVADPV